MEQILYYYGSVSGGYHAYKTDHVCVGLPVIQSLDLLKPTNGMDINSENDFMTLVKNSFCGP